MIATLHRRSNTRASAPRATGTAAFAISVDGLFPDHHTGYTITSGSTQAGTLTWSATGPIGNTTFRLEVFDGYVTRASSTTFTITVANEVLTFLHPNVTGSPIMATDASGAVLWREDYQAYGERIRKESGSTSANGSNPATAPAANNRAWFTGKLHDETTGLSYFGARYYDPQVGRFMGFDPAGFDEHSPLSFNRYAYANNNPFKFVDPDGRDAREVFPANSVLGAVGRSFGALAAYAHGVATGDETLKGIAIAGMAEHRQGNIEAIVVVASLGRGGIATSAKSPTIQCCELVGKSAAEIRQLAQDKALVPHATRADKWLDPVTGKERLRLDQGHIDRTTGKPFNDPKAAQPHHHAYQPDGKTKVVDPKDNNAHFPTAP